LSLWDICYWSVVWGVLRIEIGFKLCCALFEVAGPIKNLALLRHNFYKFPECQLLEEKHEFELTMAILLLIK